MATWSSSFLGWVETTHFSASSHFIAVSHFPCYPYMLLFKGLLSYFFYCSYSYFICGSFNIPSTNLCSSDKNCFAYFYLKAFAYSSSFFFLLFCHLSPSPGMQTLDAQILPLWWRALSNTPLLEEKEEGEYEEFRSAPGVGATKWQVLIFVSMTAMIKCYFFISLWIYIFTVSFQTAWARRW